MKDLVQMCVVLAIQYMACRLADWAMTETLFTLTVIFIWQGVFIYLFRKITRKQNNPAGYKYNGVIWYGIFPVISLCSPLLALAVFVGGLLSELRKIAGCISTKDWLKSQVVTAPGYRNNAFDDDFEFPRTNPATGLYAPLGVDGSGNAIGCNNYYDNRWRE